MLAFVLLDLFQQGLHLFLTAQGDLRTCGAWINFSIFILSSCSYLQALRLFLNAQGDLRTSGAWINLQSARQARRGFVDSTTRFFKQVRVPLLSPKPFSCC